MFRLTICAIALCVFLLPQPAKSGDLDGAARALENLADMARSADNANEAFKDALRGNPSRYDRQRYYDRRYREDFRHYDDYEDYAWERRHLRRKMIKERLRYERKMAKERAKAWRKHVRKWRKHHDDD